MPSNTAKVKNSETFKNSSSLSNNAENITIDLDTSKNGNYESSSPNSGNIKLVGDMQKATLFTFRRFIQFVLSEKAFLRLIAIGFVISLVASPMPSVARWVGFIFAAYAVVANDSIQTIGTFIASNKEKKWWVLWFFIGGIFVVTMLCSFINYNGDVSYGRLAAKGFEKTPESFSIFQLTAPLILLVLTRLRMPVSTTFLILSCFATSSGSILKVLTKSLSGYFIAFFSAIILWRLLTPTTKKLWSGPPHPLWRSAQWLTTGFLWSVWLMQDAANVAVFLPRSLSLIEFAGFTTIIFFGLGLLLYQRGDRIQSIVDSKTDMVDVRSATVVDLLYGVILYYFKIMSSIPMSTTWVFLGLLAGREYGLLFAKHPGAGNSVKKVSYLVFSDVIKATLGLLISLLLAFIINPKFVSGIF